jgi:uracil phosphoribosyltransferase
MSPAPLSPQVESELRKLCHVVEHPVLKHKLTVMREKKTSPLSFRMIMEEISQFLAYEATRDLPLKKIPISTPMEELEADQVSEAPIIVSIMRAGNGMLPGMMRILPFAAVGHVGMYRDKFIKNTVEYYFRLPKEVKGKRILLLDPMLATGETASAAIDRLKTYGVGQIRFICLLAAPEGIRHLKEVHPDVEIYTTSLERCIDEKGYIRPGVGDAGERLYDVSI